MTDLSPELRDRLALALIPGLGPKTTAALVKHFGSPAAVRRATAAQLRDVPGVGDKTARQFADALQKVNLDAELALLDRHRTAVVALDLPGYPPPLMPLAGSPPVLYTRGTYAPADERAVAIVGSRECTPYGRKVTERLARDLAARGYTVVSGLARGIDGIAHRAALDAGGRTVAVLAGGLSRIYPPEHADLAAAVAANGALFSEAPMAQSPQPGMFPQRNRIVSGLSRAVVVIEAGDKSGALGTARHAAEQGREVFAVPGNVDSPASAGCLSLLRTGAKLLRGIDDLLEEIEGVRTAPVRTPDLFPPPAAAPPPPPAPAPKLDGVDGRVWAALADGPLHADVLAERLTLDPATLARSLMMLEMRKFAKRLPGGVFERAR